MKLDKWETKTQGYSIIINKDVEFCISREHFNKKEYLEDVAKKFTDRLKALYSKGQWDGTLSEEGQMEVRVERGIEGHPQEAATQA